MNQRLLQRLQRHGAFPQARPDAKGIRQSDSVRPFGADRPRLALPQQLSSGAQPRLISQAPTSQPLESEMAFPNSPLVASALSALPMKSINSSEIQDASRGEAQAEVAALEDFGAVADRADFSEIPFSVNDFSLTAQTADPTNLDVRNTEAISTDTTNTNTTNADTTGIAQAQPTATPEPKASRSASQSATRAPSQLEPTTEVGQALAQSAAPRTVGSPAVARRIQPNSPTVEIPIAQPLTAQILSAPNNLLESPTTDPSVTEDAIAEARGTILELSAALASQEMAGFAVSDASAAGLSPASSSAEAPLPTDSPTEPRSLESQSPESQSSDALPAQSNPSFDRKAAMLELGALGVKVRVTLSNVAMQAQLEAARATALSAAAAVPAARLASSRVADATAERDTLERTAPQSQTVVTSREDAGESQVGAVNLRASVAPVDPPAAAVMQGERDSSAAGKPPAASRINSLEVNPARDMQTSVELPAYGVVAAVEVYNPPNRRATVTRPKAEETPKSEAEALFSTLPDSSPLEWLGRLGIIGAVDVEAPNPSQSLIAPERTVARIGASRMDPLPTNTVPTNTVPTNTVLTDATLANLALTNAVPTNASRLGSPPPSLGDAPAPSTSNVTRNPLVAPRTEAAKPATPTASRAEPASSNLAAVNVPANAQRVAPTTLESLAPSVGGSASAPVSSAIQRQVASSDAAVPTSLQESTPQDGRQQDSRQESSVSGAKREPRADNKALERSVNQRSVNQRSADQPQALEAATAGVNTNNLGALEQGAPLRADASQFSSRSGADNIGRNETEDSQQISEAGNPAFTGEFSSSDAAFDASVSSDVALNESVSRDDVFDASTSSDVVLNASVSSDVALNESVSSDAILNAPAYTGIPLSNPTSSNPPHNLAESRIKATGTAPAAQSGLNAPGDAAIATGQTSTTAPARADLAPQGTPAAVEVYNPPNRRATVTRPKAEEASKSEAEALFSTLPDSSPLEWLGRLGIIGAVELDANSPRVAPALTPMDTVRSADSVGAATLLRAALPAGQPQPGLRSTSDVGPARVAANAAQIANALPVSPALPINPARTLEVQRSESQLETGNPASSAERLASNSETQIQTQTQSNPIGSSSRVAPLVAASLGAAPSSAQLIATPPQTAAPRVAAGPVRLSSSAARLIAPITGIDPSSVEIRRDAESDALTRNYRADALTVDGTVLLSARMTGETPETLGVIAHELTHVARGRQPRFVPPALRQPQSLAPGSATGVVTPSLEGLGEEGIALQVEGMTRALAQPGMAQGGAQLSNVGSNGERSSSGATTPRSAEAVPWSNGLLPAPWELMDRLEALTNPGLSTARNQNPQRGVQSAASQQPPFQQPTSQQPASQPARSATPFAVRSEAVMFAGGAVNQSASSVSSSGAGGNFFGGIGGGSAAPRSVQAAEQGRSVPTPSPAGPLPKSPETTQKPANGASPAPDLDDLARQVYAVLKRRLITERRRSS